MPIDYREYHPKWSLIVRLVLKRDGHHCCKCRLPNHVLVIRIPTMPYYRYPNQTERDWIKQWRQAGYSEGQIRRRLNMTMIVLTVAHLDGDKTHNRFYNLASLCQRCHLNHDLQHHIENRKYGRHHRGPHQLDLWP